jgi:hypothetical protein
MLVLSESLQVAKPYRRRSPVHPAGIFVHAVIEKVADKGPAGQVQRSRNDRVEVRLPISATSKPKQVAEQVV